MKRDATLLFVAKCLTCQKVKSDHHRSIGLLQFLDILVWKRDNISMDFVLSFRKMQEKTILCG